MHKIKIRDNWSSCIPITNDHIEVICRFDLLLSYGFKLNILDEENQNELHYFCDGYYDPNYLIIEYLINKGLNKYQKDINGNTPLDNLNNNSSINQDNPILKPIIELLK